MTVLSRYLRPAAAVCLTVAAAAAAGGQEPIRTQPLGMEAGIRDPALSGANPDGSGRRVASSDAELAGRRYVMEVMRGAGHDARDFASAVAPA